MNAAAQHSTAPSAGPPGNIAPHALWQFCRRAGDVAARWWNCVLRCALVLWVVRVPLVATLTGLLLLSMTPQAQDLFVEFAVTPLWFRALFILWFLFILLAVWAMPTHYAARVLLDTDGRLQDSLAQERASHSPACLECSAVWVPRLLGFLTFVAVEIAILRSWMNMPTLDETDITAGVAWALVEVAIAVALGAALYVVWVIIRRRRKLEPPRRLVGLNEKLASFWQIISPGRVRGAPEEADRDVGRFILLGVFIFFVSIFFFGAERIGGFFPRALAVPFILGGWLPFLSWLSGVGRQIRAPLIAGLFVLIAVLALVLGDNHSVRLIAANTVAGAQVDKQPMRLQDAVNLWMKENQCDPQKDDDNRGASCPRPIIIAAAGGASRAGFFTATILGYFMQEASKHGLDADTVRKRLFAISSVSGGSLGAVMVTAALNAETDGNEHPCVTTAVDQWWGKAVGNWRDCFEALTSGDFLTADFFGFAFNDMLPFGPWRDRAAVLEDSWRNRYRDVAINANKSATPPSCKGLDCPFLSLRPRSGHWIPLLVLSGTSEATGGRIVTTSLAMTYTPQTTTPGACATSVGHESCPLFVEAESFHELLRRQVPRDRWWGWLGFPERYFRRGATGDDVRLSTAAHNSARFPIISPPGSIRSQSRGQNQRIIDRIVDGGYFENYGALGAKELALAVHAVEPSLMPLVVVISNDPADLLDPNDDAVSNLPSLPRPPAASGELITDATSSLTTFANARTAHGILSVAELESALHKAIPDCGNLVMLVRVWPDHDKTLSMSWWESSVIQRQLHRQTEECTDRGKDCVSSPQPGASTKGADQNRNLPHLNAIWSAMTDPRCIIPASKTSSR
jgi:hypothetical protein